ncbi:Glycine betaine/carnitine/choline-binding protein OpuCC precursor [Jeotgalicoccus aerolatus]|uniref:Osmoprotectant transport system substrate-binding protein n=1 Tax=Jeotgalicoccus aerolatus TaxID=709510 RepID=A0ABS4HMH3_9STAP|nr:osmoprotectant ABC transporter substrate-binding protein [Jeotgalicoccus aerolatus]MBP1952120.1 osmoprotectant transport system substrate-binding protein [Jeotgalicoccus aerolatus]GGE06060.1 osmoprotectant ABC transporter substrate-binding protein [Jeotgalicoccus aerolatus]CAD2070927.1 Glycine betaine/carnitine/choline-binding protein OpuCC precursor [Jeotgalicoccus aerolatus]
MRQMKKLLALLVSLTVLSGCSLPGLSSSSSDGIAITSMTTTESQIVSHMSRLMIEHYSDGEIEPTMINNLGSSTIQHNALLSGDAQVSGVRYTGTELTGVLDKDPESDPDIALEQTQKAFDEEFDMKFYDSYGFDNTYAFMVTSETAEEYDLETTSDLAAYTDEFAVGVDTSWFNRPGDGYPAFQEAYGFEFDNIRAMQISLVYEALNTGSLDLALGYTTDGRIPAYDLVVLEDDLQFFPPYDASPFATHEIIAEYPEIDDALSRLVGTVSTETMQNLNYRSDEEGIEPALVAEEFLEEHNYFEEEGE